MLYVLYKKGVSEIVAVEIQRTVFVSVYTQPEDNTVLIENLDGLCCQISKEGKRAVIFGGFNAHHQEWLKSVSVTNKRGTKPKQFFVLHGLKNLVHKPTRGKTMLDLVFVPSDAEGKVKVLAKIGTSDHKALKVSLGLGMEGIQIQEVPGRKVYHWSSANVVSRKCKWNSRRLLLSSAIFLCNNL